MVGIFCFFGLVAMFSSNLRAVNWRTIGWGIGLQLILAVLVLPVALLALVLGRATADTEFWLRWLLGPVVVALLIVACASMALLVADRVSRRALSLRPHAVDRRCAKELLGLLQHPPPGGASLVELHAASFLERIDDRVGIAAHA